MGGDAPSLNGLPYGCHLSDLDRDLYILVSILRIPASDYFTPRITKLHARCISKKYSGLRFLDPKSERTRMGRGSRGQKGERTRGKARGINGEIGSL